MRELKDDGKSLATGLRVATAGGGDAGTRAARGIGPTPYSELEKARNQVIKEIARWQAKYFDFSTWCLV